MQPAPIPFEPTNSFCYRFARYRLLPEIMALPAVQSGEPFRLVDLVKQHADMHLSPEQQAATYQTAETGATRSVIQTVKWYVPYLAKKTGQLTSLGDGTYRLPDPSDIPQSELEDAALDDGDSEAAEGQGYIYAFTFPALVRNGAPFPIKVGMTAGDVQQRVMQQCKGAATFDNPQVLGFWKVARVGHVESAIHKVLAARGKWREGVPGTEWFDTTLDEIRSIVQFTTGTI